MEELEVVPVVEENNTTKPSVDCFEYVSRAYVVYGSNVNTSRAFPSIYDGLKPVQRKLILSAQEVASNKEVSSANIVGQCLTGDTEILDINYNKIKIIDVVKRLQSGENIYTFSCSSSKEISATRIIKAWKTENKSPLVSVTIETGESVKCTFDHKFMMKNGTYKEAKDLIVGDSLMSECATEDDSDNYKVFSVKPIEVEDVYDIEVESTNHNFLLGIGVFVHNCISFYHPHSDCLSGWTKVLLSDYSSETIEHLTKINKDQEVYSVDLKTGKIVKAVATNFREVKKNNLWHIALSDGGSLHCSGNHPILMRDKTYEKAENLKPGDMVFSLELFKRGRNISNTDMQFTLVSVVSIKKVEDDEIILYDFTVPEYENMIIKTSENTLLCVHNSGVYKAMVNMINAEDPVLSGHGAFGYKGGLVEIDAAHMRYTAAGMNQFGLKLFCEYLDYVEKEENDLYNKEPRYLPTPIPYALLNGSTGIGLGAITSIPACTVDSLKKWISKYLKTGKTTELIIPKYAFNETSSELEKFNNEGVGIFQFFAKVEKSKDKKSVLVSEFPSYIPPSRLLKEFKVELQSRLVTIVQLNDSNNRPLVRIEKAPHTRSINVDDIYNRTKKCMTKNVTFKSVVTDGKKAYIFSPQNWMKFTVDCYLSFVNFGLKRELEKLQEAILFNKVKNYLADFFLKKMSDDDIVSSLNSLGYSVTLDSVVKWSRKSISTLRADEISVDNLLEKSKEIEENLSNINNYTLNKILQILK